MRLPKTWSKITAGHYRHPETGTEIVNTWGGRKLSEWWVCVPPRNDLKIDPEAEGRCPVIHEIATLTEAIDRAETEVIPRTREMIDKAWREAQWEKIGTPETWTEGQADKETLSARLAAIWRTQRGTGSEARTGDLVKHVELGTVAVFDHADLSGAYARFAFDTETTLVHPDDIVVLEGLSGWHSCERGDSEPEHAEHDEAVSPECLIPLPDAGYSAGPGFECSDRSVPREAAPPSPGFRLARAFGGDTADAPTGLTLDGLRAQWADNPLALKLLARFAGICAPGTRLWVYGWPWCFGVTVTGLVPNHVEEIFGGCEADTRPRFVAPLIAYTRDDTGEEGTVGPTPVMLRAKAAVLWNVLAADGLLIRGGIDSIIRAKQIADDHGPDCLLRLGLPPNRGFDVHSGDDGDFTDPDVAAQYETDVAKIRAATQTAADGPGPDTTQTQTRTQTEPSSDDDAATVASPSPVPGPGPVAFGYRFETQTNGTWREVRTGYTPPQWRPVQTMLDTVADTMLGNARQVLGLGPKDRLPQVRVQTWHERSGLTGHAPNVH